MNQNSYIAILINEDKSSIQIYFEEDKNKFSQNIRSKLLKDNSGCDSILYIRRMRSGFCNYLYNLLSNHVLSAEYINTLKDTFIKNSKHAIYITPKKTDALDRVEESVKYIINNMNII